MPGHKLRCRRQPIGRIYEVRHGEQGRQGHAEVAEVAEGKREQEQEQDLLRRRLGETMPETCTQIAQSKQTKHKTQATPSRAK